MRTPREMIVNTWRVLFASQDPHASLIELTRLVLNVEPLAVRLREAASTAIRREVRGTLDAVVLLGADRVGRHAQALLRDCEDQLAVGPHLPEAPALGQVGPGPHPELLAGV